MKSQKKQTKLLFGFALSMMDKAIEMQQAKNEFQDLKNEELRLKSNTPSVEQIFPLGGEFVVPTRFKNKEKEEKIDEKLKAEVENDPLFKLFDDILNPNKNKEIIDEIMKDKRFPSGGIVVKDVKIQDEKPTKSDDTCPCEACVLRRQLKERNMASTIKIRKFL